MQFAGLFSGGVGVPVLPSCSATLGGGGGGARGGTDLPAKSSHLPLQPWHTAPQGTTPAAALTLAPSRQLQTALPRPCVLLSTSCRSPAETPRGPESPPALEGFSFNVKPPWVERWTTGSPAGRPQSQGTVLVLLLFLGTLGVSGQMPCPCPLPQGDWGDPCAAGRDTCGMWCKTKISPGCSAGRGRSAEENALLSGRSKKNLPASPWFLPSPGGLCCAGAPGVPECVCWQRCSLCDFINVIMKPLLGPSRKIPVYH